VVRLERVRRATKIGLGVAGAVATWLAALGIAGLAARGCVGERMRSRLADSLDADVRLGGLDLGLIRGRAVLRDLAIERDHDGHLHVDVAEIDAGIAPLGAYLWDRDLGRVGVAGVDLDVSGWGVLHIRPPRRPPIRFARLSIDGARLSFAVAEAAPAWARMTVTIERAEAGPTVLRTPLSWVFALERLEARLELPGAGPVELRYGAGRLEASGSLFGDTPVSIPVTLPAPEPGHEGRQLATLGADVAERLTLARASGWLHDRFGLDGR
jgi:hypothetical protein